MRVRRVTSAARVERAAVVMRFMPLALLAILLNGPSAAAAVSMHGAQTSLAVLPFEVAPVGMNDEVLPRADELADLRVAFVAALDATPGLHGVAVARGCGADTDVTCARRAGRRAGTPFVVAAHVTRFMGLLWQISFETIDVRSGAVDGPWNDEYKGDFNSLEHAMPDVTAGLASLLKRHR